MYSAYGSSILIVESPVEIPSVASFVHVTVQEPSTCVGTSVCVAFPPLFVQGAVLCISAL